MNYKSRLQQTAAKWSLLRLLYAPHRRVQAAALLLCAVAAPSYSQPSPGVFGPGPGCNLFPAPASVGATVDISYFGPPPSENNPSLVGPVQLLKSSQVNVQKGTVTLPLYQGTLAGSGKTYLVHSDRDQRSGDRVTARTELFRQAELRRQRGPHSHVRRQQQSRV